MAVEVEKDRKERKNRSRFIVFSRTSSFSKPLRDFNALSIPGIPAASAPQNPRPLSDPHHGYRLVLRRGREREIKAGVRERNEREKRNNPSICRTSSSMRLVALSLNLKFFFSHTKK